MQGYPFTQSFPNLIQNQFKSSQTPYPFLPRNHQEFQSTLSEIDSLPTFKKSNINKINLHQLQFDAEDLAGQPSQELKREQIIIQSLHQNSNEDRYQNPTQKPKSAHKREIKALTQTKHKASHQIRSECSSLFNQGFLPDVKKFYSTFKHLDRQKDKQRLLRNTTHHSESEKPSLNILKLAQNIRTNEIFPKRLGMIGRNSCHQINQNNVHMTKKEMKTLAQGMALIDVKKIGLSNNKLTKQNAKLLFQNLPQKLEKINLKSALKTRDILTSLNSQKLKSGHLKKLNLSDNKITDTGLLCIEQVLSANVNFEILNLSSNLITDQSCELLGKFVDKSLNLRNLNLAWNQICGKKSYFLFDAMTTSSSLLNVNLSRNKIGYCLIRSVSDPIFSNKQISGQKHKKITAKYSSLEAICQFLKKNNNLLHLDLSFNSIEAEDCEVIAQTFNIFNQSLVGFHFQGNSNYKTNYLGYLIEQSSASEDQNHITLNNLQQDRLNDSDKNQKTAKIHFQDNKNAVNKGLFNKIDFNSLDEQQQNAILKEKKSMIKTKNSNYTKPKRAQHQYHLGSECWMCNGWITESFSFEITKSKLQAFETLKTQRKNQPEQNQIKNVYIHLQNYDYQPLLMKVHKNPKKAFENMALGQQRNSKTKLKTFNDADLKKKTLQSLNTIAFCDGISTNSYKNINLEEEEYVFYHIFVKIPANQKLKYFFTIHGEVFLNQESSILTLNKQMRNIKFETFNPFRKGMNQKFQSITKKFKGNQRYHGINQKIRELIEKLPPSMQINIEQHPVSSYYLHLSEMNIYTQKSKTKNTQNFLQHQAKLHEIYEKLIEGKEQLKAEDYETLIQQRTMMIKQKEEGSEKYISSDKLIKENELINYGGTNENELTFLKPRNKNLFFGHSDPKSITKIDFAQRFAILTYHLERLLKYENQADVSEAEQLIDKIIKELASAKKDSQKQNNAVHFYPAKIQLNSKNLYLNFCQSAKSYYLKKMKVDNFTGQILRIGNFDQEYLGKTQQSIHLENTEQNKHMISEASKIKISKVSPYVLIKYAMLKQDDAQNSTNFDIYDQFEQKKSIIKSQRSNQKKQTRKMSDRNSPTTSEYVINIMKAERKDNQNENTNNIDKKNQNNQTSKTNALLTAQVLKIDLQQLGSQSNISAISMRLVQEILFPKNTENNQSVNPLQTQISKKQAEAQISFVQKVQNWKVYNQIMDFDFEEKGVLKIVSQQILSGLQQKIERSKSVKKIPSNKPNKFNLKINKFCSLESSTHQAHDLNLTSFLGQKKRPNFNLNSKKVQFGSDPNDDPLNLGNHQLGFDIDSPLRQNNEKLMDANRLKRLQDKLNGINISKQIQLFLLFDALFEQNFCQSSLHESIDTYIQKINTYVNRRNSRNQNNQQKVSFIGANKNKGDKESLLKQQTLKQFTKSTSKTILRKNIKVDSDKSCPLPDKKKNMSKNIFQFLADQRQKQHVYFPGESEPQSFPFNETVQQNKKLDITQQILNRFEYICVNLIKNLTKSQEKSVFPSGAREILLKELFIYRCFLFNSPEKDYKDCTNKLIETVQTGAEGLQSQNPDFITRVKRHSFKKILDLLQEHLLYTIFFLTKHIAFLSFANKYKRSSKRLSRDNKSSEGKLGQNKIGQDIQGKISTRQRRVSVDPKKEPQNKVASAKLPSLMLSKTKENDSLISYIKNKPEKFGQELRKQMKSVMEEIFQIVTKLHIKYDVDIEKQKSENSSIGGLSKKKTLALGKKSPEKMEQKIRADSEKSSKNVSGEKSRSKKMKKSKSKKSSQAQSKKIKLKKQPRKLSLLDKNEDLPKQ